MGKALIFDGLTVASPLETVTFTQICDEAELISSYFGDNITNNQLIALNVLINKLKSDGVFAKLRYLMIPMLASNVNQAAQNVLITSTSSRVPSITHLVFADGELKNDGNYTEITNLSNQIVSPSQDMDFGNGVSFGFYVSDVSGEDNKTFLTLGSIRTYRSSGTVQFKKSTESESVMMVGTNYLDDTLASFSASFDNVEYTLKVSKLVGNNNVSNKEITVGTSLANFDGEELKLYGNFNGGIKFLWVGEGLDNTELTNAHLAFKEFKNTINALVIDTAS